MQPFVRVKKVEGGMKLCNSLRCDWGNFAVGCGDVVGAVGVGGGWCKGDE